MGDSVGAASALPRLRSLSIRAAVGLMSAVSRMCLHAALFFKSWRFNRPPAAG
jgi:uncharacterized membrane protein